MEKLLEGKVALITGASRGIGRGIAELFAKEGALLVLGSRLEEEISSVSQEIKEKYSTESAGFALDVSDLSSIQDFVQNAIARFQKIDILVNNAGIIRHQRFLDATPASYAEQMDVNLKGAFFMMQAVARVMKDQGTGGKIINISSCAVRRPLMDHSVYTASKAALSGVNRVAALELGPYGITCNCILPGITETDMVRDVFLSNETKRKAQNQQSCLGRIATVEDQAKAALFLASSLSDYITGEMLTVSGGRVMTP